MSLCFCICCIKTFMSLISMWFKLKVGQFCENQLTSYIIYFRCIDSRNFSWTKDTYIFRRLHIAQRFTGFHSYMRITIYCEDRNRWRNWAQFTENFNENVFKIFHANRKKTFGRKISILRITNISQECLKFSNSRQM